MSSLTAALGARRGAVIAIFVALAAALSIAVYNGRDMFRPGSDNDVANAFRNGVGQGINGIKAVGDTVASLFESRSPGERAEGALASLKHRRPVLHQRALPKVRRPASPLAGIVGAVPIPPVVPPVIPGPLYNVVNGAPPPPVALSPPGGPGPPGRVFPGFSFPGGGGGGIVIPPPAIITPPDTPVVPVTPVTPVTPGIPEPSTWAMMLLGFAIIGSAVARKARSLSQAANS